MPDYQSVGTPAAQEQATASNESLGRFAIRMGFFVTVFLVVGMIADKQQVTLALLCGLSFFVFLVVFVVLVLSGQLRDMLGSYQREVTLREQQRMQYTLYLQEPPQLEGTGFPLLAESEDGQEPSRNFVPARPAVTPHIKAAADAYLLGLFRNGAPDPDRILPDSSRSPGQVQAKKPPKEVLDYLLALEVMQGGGKGEMLFFNRKQYADLRACRLAIKYGVPVRHYQEPPATEGE